eukprot:CAMPEP_0182879276 /NCGR_PEP_ID=MMETSP0034_2-20130328/15877_1 /TAXON_ID=156128 /ORGANISM="Nephroselmis pyriformis, Strain CCMP717" /LENGTH=177 /DNA_ID=CAMNT_0025012205 /DNA_START=9 /DNA_END=539 /DNA_ORIENTATION=-
MRGPQGDGALHCARRAQQAVEEGVPRGGAVDELALEAPQPLLEGAVAGEGLVAFFRLPVLEVCAVRHVGGVPKLGLTVGPQGGRSTRHVALAEKVLKLEVHAPPRARGGGRAFLRRHRGALCYGRLTATRAPRSLCAASGPSRQGHARPCQAGPVIAVESGGGRRPGPAHAEPALDR